MTLEILLPDWIGIAIILVILGVMVVTMIAFYPGESAVTFAFIAFAGVIYVMMVLFGILPSDGIVPNLVVWKIAGAP